MSQNIEDKHNVIIILSSKLAKANDKQQANKEIITNLTNLIEKNNSLIQNISKVEPTLFLNISSKINKINKDLLESATIIENSNSKLKSNPLTHNIAINALKKIINSSDYNSNIDVVEYNYIEYGLYDYEFHSLDIEPINVTLDYLNDKIRSSDKNSIIDSIVWEIIEKLQANVTLVKNQLSSIGTIINHITPNEEYQQDIILNQEKIKNYMEAREIAGKEYELEEQSRISKELDILNLKNTEYSNTINKLNHENIIINNEIKTITQEIINTVSVQ